MMALSISLREGESGKFKKIIEESDKKTGRTLKYRITPKGKLIVFPTMDDYREFRKIIDIFNEQGDES